MIEGPPKKGIESTAVPPRDALEEEIFGAEGEEWSAKPLLFPQTEESAAMQAEKAERAREETASLLKNMDTAGLVTAREREQWLKEHAVPEAGAAEVAREAEVPEPHDEESVLDSFFEDLSTIDEMEGVLGEGEAAGAVPPTERAEGAPPAPAETVPAEAVAAPEQVAVEAEIEAVETAKATPEFFGIKPEELAEIPGWDKLSPGQQRLALENLKQLTLGRIKEDSQAQYKKAISEEKAPATQELKTAIESVKTGFREKKLSRIIEGIAGASNVPAALWRHVWIGMRESFGGKGYKTLLLEGKNYRASMAGGMKAHRGVLEVIIAGAQNGPGVKEAADGSLLFEYLPTDVANFSPEDRATADAFNGAATALAKIPDEWKYDTASESQRGKHEKAKEKYDTARGKVLTMLYLSERSMEASEKGARENAFQFVNSVDAMVRMNQFFNTHEDAEKELSKIESRGFWGRVGGALLSVGTERAVYGLAGYGARLASVSALGLVGAPLAAAGIGGFRARRRAAQTLRERAVAARHGEEDTSSEARNVVSAPALAEKILRLTNQLGEIDEDVPSEKTKKLARALSARIEYTRRKLDEGRVNFGNEKDRTANQYALLDVLGHSSVAVEAGTVGAKMTLAERIDRFLGFKERNIREAEGKYKHREMVRGALTAAGFAAAGWLIRDFFSGEQVAAEGMQKAARGFDEALYAAREGAAARAVEATATETPLSREDEAEAAARWLASNYEELKKWIAGFSPKEIDMPSEADLAVLEAEDAAVRPPPEIDVKGGNRVPDGAMSTEEVPQTPAASVAEELIRKQEAASIAETILTPEAPVAEMLKELSYKGGKSIWQESELQLKERFKDIFEKLGGADPNAAQALKTWNIDRVKDTIVDNPGKYLPAGANVDRLTADQLRAVKWDDAFADTFKKGGLTQDLSFEKIAAIVKNNEDLREFFRAHPDAPRTTDNYKAILHGAGDTGEAQPPTKNDFAPPTERSAISHGAGQGTPHRLSAEIEVPGSLTVPEAGSAVFETAEKGGGQLSFREGTLDVRVSPAEDIVGHPGLKLIHITETVSAEDQTPPAVYEKDAIWSEQGPVQIITEYNTRDAADFFKKDPAEGAFARAEIAKMVMDKKVHDFVEMKEQLEKLLAPDLADPTESAAAREEVTRSLAEWKIAPDLWGKEDQLKFWVDHPEIPKKTLGEIFRINTASGNVLSPETVARYVESGFVEKMGRGVEVGLGLSTEKLVEVIKMFEAPDVAKESLTRFLGGEWRSGRFVPVWEDSGLFSGVESSVDSQGNLKISFDVKDNPVSVDLYIYKNGAIAVDGYGNHNLHLDGGKLLSDKTLKEALDFITRKDGKGAVFFAPPADDANRG